VTWQPGRDKIAELLEAAELQPVTADLRVAQLLLDDAGRHLATAAIALSSSDLSGAYQLVYDALRTEPRACWPCRDTGPSAASRARNSFEYPRTHAPGPSREEVRDAIAAAT